MLCPCPPFVPLHDKNDASALWHARLLELRGIGMFLAGGKFIPKRKRKQHKQRPPGPLIWRPKREGARVGCNQGEMPRRAASRGFLATTGNLYGRDNGAPSQRQQQHPARTSFQSGEIENGPLPAKVPMLVQRAPGRANRASVRTTRATRTCGARCSDVRTRRRREKAAQRERSNKGRSAPAHAILAHCAAALRLPIRPASA